MKIHLKKQGFTLVELMAAMLAATILLLIVGLLLMLPVKTKRTNDEYAILRRNMAFAMQRISKDVRESAFYDQESYPGNYGNKLVLPAVPEPSTIRSYQIEYDLSGNALNRTADGTSETLIGEGVVHFWSATTNYVGGGGAIIVGLELENQNSEITIQHEALIHTRN